MRGNSAEELRREPGADAEATLCDHEHQEYEIHLGSSLSVTSDTVNGQEVAVLRFAGHGTGGVVGFVGVILLMISATVFTQSLRVRRLGETSDG